MKNHRRHFVKQLGAATVLTAPVPLLGASSVLASAIPKGTTVLFQGDSITDGNRTRDQDWNHVLGHGYAYLISARLWYQFPTHELMFYNRGISGNRLSDLEARWQTDTLDLKPDVLSLLIGVNDILAIMNGGGESAATFEARYRSLINRTRQHLPETQIVLCEPFMLPTGWIMSKADIWQAELPKRQQIVKQLATEYGTTFLPLQGIFEEACRLAPASFWMWDGIHPMPAGHELMARKWLEAMGWR